MVIGGTAGDRSAPLASSLVSGRCQWRQSEAQGGALVWRYEARSVPVKKGLASYRQMRAPPCATLDHH